MSEFNDEYISEHLDPLAQTHQDFDYDAVAEALGEKSEPDREEQMRRAAHDFYRILIWILGPGPLNERTQAKVGARLIAAARIICPEVVAAHPQLEKLFPKKL